MESLHRNKGGASSKRAEPSEKEGMGLAVGAAMLWCKLRDSTSGAFEGLTKAQAAGVDV